MQPKHPKDSFIVMSELVLPNDTNVLGNLMGGRLMHWMDIAAAIASQKHCNCPVVTASVDNLSFASPIRLGNLLTIEAIPTRAFNTSLEVYLRVWGEDLTAQYKYLSNEAYFTFVALDPHGKPRQMPQLLPDTDTEKRMFDGALRRRQLRLILAGKMKPEDAGELRSLFITENA
jgi:acyl-CoA hydrolase